MSRNDLASMAVFLATLALAAALGGRHVAAAAATAAIGYLAGYENGM